MDTVISFVKSHVLVSIVAVVIVVLAVGAAFLQPHTGQTYTVTRENLVNTVLVNGTYTIAAQTPVMSPTNGVITKLFVTNDAVVKKGDELFHVESSATADQQKAALAAYLAAKSQLDADTAALYSVQSTMYSAWKVYTDLATNSTYQNSDGSQKDINRNLPEFTTAQDNWLAAEANYKNQQGVIAKSQAAAASTWLTYSETQSVTVTAPAAGKIINLSNEVNDQVTAQTANTTPVPVLVIADFANPVVISAVDQVNVPHITIGDKATIVFDALPDKEFTGSVESIDTAGTKTQGTVTYNVRMKLNGSSDLLRPTMTASVTIETERKNKVLTVPNDAIITKQGTSYIRMKGADANHLTPVSLGLKGLTKTEVTAGVSAGNVVMVAQ